MSHHLQKLLEIYSQIKSDKEHATRNASESVQRIIGDIKQLAKPFVGDVVVETDGEKTFKRNATDPRPERYLGFCGQNILITLRNDLKISTRIAVFVSRDLRQFMICVDNEDVGADVMLSNAAIAIFNHLLKAVQNEAMKD